MFHDLIRCGLMWRAVHNCCSQVRWCDVIWRDVMRCDLMWRDVMWYDVMWCDVMHSALMKYMHTNLRYALIHIIIIWVWSENPVCIKRGGPWTLYWKETNAVIMCFTPCFDCRPLWDIDTIRTFNNCNTFSAPLHVIESPLNPCSYATACELRVLLLLVAAQNVCGTYLSWDEVSCPCFFVRVADRTSWSFIQSRALAVPCFCWQLRIFRNTRQVVPVSVHFTQAG
jgi:hypothetical protein